MPQLPTGTINKMIAEKALMPPLWLVYPEYCQYSMAFRMGTGENYATKFGEWFCQLSEEDREQYRRLFPLPVGWYGWWSEELVDDPTFYEKGELFTGYWEPTQSTLYSARWFENAIAEGGYHITVCDNSIGNEKLLPCGWASTSFTAPLRDPERGFYSVLEYVLKCQSAYFGDDALDALIDTVIWEPQRRKELMPRIFEYSDAEWERILPGLVCLGFYYQISQNRSLRDLVLASDDREIVIVTDETDRRLCGALSEDGRTLEGDNLLGFSLMNARREVCKIYENAHLCSCFEK